MRLFQHDPHTRTMRASTARLLLALCAVALVASPLTAAPLGSAFAETTPRAKGPKPHATNPVDAQAKSSAGTPAQTTPPNPVIPDPRNRIPTPTGAITFSAAQVAEAAKASNYLSSFSLLDGNFVQVGPDGSRTTGEFYIQKPGKIRFEYDDPSPIAIVADGQSVIVRDRKLATQDVYPLSQTPLRYLLSDRIDLLRDTNVINVAADDLYISVTIEEKQALVGTSRLLMMFGAKDGQLKQWTVTDPQGYDTTVAIYNVNTPKTLDPALFAIDFTNYANPNN